MLIQGKMPLVFFDEFDASVALQPRAWLKSFLAPMQDGTFRDGPRVHRIERAIFVFAGGTAHAFSGFAGDAGDKEMAKLAAAEKRPDFLSRLHGYINITGIDLPDEANKALYLSTILTRAVMLRSNLARTSLNLFEGHDKDKGALRISASVSRALLRVPYYTHGARSLESILRMSALTPASVSFDMAMLPSDEQLRLHVDAEAFRRLLLSEQGSE